MSEVLSASQMYRIMSDAFEFFEGNDPSQTHDIINFEEQLKDVEDKKSFQYQVDTLLLELYKRFLEYRKQLEAKGIDLTANIYEQDENFQAIIDSMRAKNFPLFLLFSNGQTVKLLQQLKSLYKDPDMSEYHKLREEFLQNRYKMVDLENAGKYNSEEYETLRKYNEELRPRIIVSRCNG